NANKKKKRSQIQFEQEKKLQEPWRWSVEEVAKYLQILIQAQLFTPILRGLKIFDPENPFLDFVRFCQAFSLCRFDSAKAYLRKYVTAMQEQCQGQQEEE
ncbi:unnamed protein product, partial [Amoebophrya sp. A120]